MKCIICEKPLELLGQIPFTTNAERKILPYDSRVVTYYRCCWCHFISCPEMYTWDLELNVYNDDYILVDPDYTGGRSKDSIKILTTLFPDPRHIKHLDYGCGENNLSKGLVGWDTIGYDPYSNPTKPTGKFNLITAFEVFEHSNNIYQLFEDLKQFLDKRGVVLFSTVLVNKETTIGNPYIAPRNGHISIFSSTSLKMMADKYDLLFHSLTPNTHILEASKNSLKGLIRGR